MERQDKITHIRNIEIHKFPIKKDSNCIIISNIKLGPKLGIVEAPWIYNLITRIKEDIGVWRIKSIK